jgi:hypothetical protein
MISAASRCPIGSASSSAGVQKPGARRARRENAVGCSRHEGGVKLEAEGRSMARLRLLVAGAVRAPEDDAPEGASSAELAALADRLGRPLPSALRTWLSICNGAAIGPGGVFGQCPGRRFLDMAGGPVSAMAGAGLDSGRRRRLRQLLRPDRRRHSRIRRGYERSGGACPAHGSRPAVLHDRLACRRPVPVRAWSRLQRVSKSRHVRPRIAVTEPSAAPIARPLNPKVQDWANHRGKTPGAVGMSRRR